MHEVGVRVQSNTDTFERSDADTDDVFHDFLHARAIYTVA